MFSGTIMCERMCATFAESWFCFFSEHWGETLNWRFAIRLQSSFQTYISMLLNWTTFMPDIQPCYDSNQRKFGTIEEWISIYYISTDSWLISYFFRRIFSNADMMVAVEEKLQSALYNNASAVLLHTTIWRSLSVPRTDLTKRRSDIHHKWGWDINNWEGPLLLLILLMVVHQQFRQQYYRKTQC